MKNNSLLIFFIVSSIVLIKTCIGQKRPYMSKGKGKTSSSVSYQELKNELTCGTSPLADPSREAANYDPNDFASTIEKYGSALLFMKDRNVYGRCPWRVQITDDQNNYLCAGVNIHDRFILTFSTCVQNLPLKSIRVRYGKYDLLNYVNEHEAYQNYESKICQRMYISTSYCPQIPETTGQLILLRVATKPDHDQYPQVKPMCLPKYDEVNRPSTPISSFDTTDSTCWLAGYNASPITQIQNQPSIIPRIAQMRRVSSRKLRSQGQGEYCNYDVEEQWVGTNGYDACVADKGTPILCFVPDQDTSSDPFTPTGSGSGLQRPIRLVPAQQTESRFRAVVVAIVKSPPVACTVYNSTQVKESQPLLATKVTSYSVDDILSLIEIYKNAKC